MPVTNSSATAAYVFREQYASNIADTALREHLILMQLLNGSNAAGHAGDFVGADFRYPMKFGNPQGVSNLFTNSQSQAAASFGAQFIATPVVKYGNVLVDGPSILRCADDGAFTDLLTMTTDDTIAAVVNMLAFDVYRTSSGLRGQRASISSNTVQLAIIDDARNFELGQTVSAAQVADGTSPRAGTTTVTGVSLSLGQITLASAAAITGFSDNDFLFNAGDPAASGSLGSMNGMEDSTPLTQPSGADSFRSVNRSQYAERLAGTRLTAAISQNQTIEENIGQSGIQVRSVGGLVTDCAINPLNFWAVVRRGNAKVIYDTPGGELNYGFETAYVSTPAGRIRLWSDPDCPTTRARGFRPASHYIRKSGDFVHIIMDDGNSNLRTTTADSVETRMRFHGNYIQSNTRDHFVFAI